MNNPKDKKQKPADSEVAGYDEGHAVDFAGDDAQADLKQPDVKDAPDASADQPLPLS